MENAMAEQFGPDTSLLVMRLKQVVWLSLYYTKPTEKCDGGGRSHHKNRRRDGAIKRNAHSTMVGFLMRHGVVSQTHLSNYQRGLGIEGM